ncbi:MAG TPA: hypothetical protein EYO33_32885, partial [Phycisphaerales bacterium]|nr:hypothetical protein [Phycisphaerales bacterium]
MIRGDLNQDGVLDEDDVQRMACVVGHPNLATYLNEGEDGYFECSQDNMADLIDYSGLREEDTGWIGGVLTDLAVNLADFTGEGHITPDDYFALGAAVKLGQQKPFLTAYSEELTAANELEQMRLFQSASNELYFTSQVLQRSQLYRSFWMQDPNAEWLLGTARELSDPLHKPENAQLYSDVLTAQEFITGTLIPELEDGSNETLA